MRRSRLVLFLALILTTGFPATPASPATPWPGFDDVTPSNIFYNDIVWLKDQAITLGCNPPENTLFCPEDPVTRGEMAAFLTRALNLSDPGAGDWFTDDDTSVFEADIDRAAQAGIVKGCDPPANTMACPDDPITRQQMASFLVRAFDLDQGGGLDWFEDDDTSIHHTDIDRLRAAWITFGCKPPTENRYCPTDPVTRQQMAAFLHRALKAPVTGSAMGARARIWPEAIYVYDVPVATFEVRNTGTTGLTGLGYGPTPGPYGDYYGNCAPEYLTGPTELLGNGNAVFDPGELQVVRCNATQGDVDNFISIQFSATTPVDTEVTAVAMVEYDTRYPPIEVEIRPSATSVTSGSRVTWTIDLVNPTTAVDLFDIHATVVFNEGNGQSPVTFTVGVGDDDDRLEPGERWTYSYSARVNDTILLGVVGEFTASTWSYQPIGFQAQSVPVLVP